MRDERNALHLNYRATPTVFTVYPTATEKLFFLLKILIANSFDGKMLDRTWADAVAVAVAVARKWKMENGNWKRASQREPSAEHSDACAVAERERLHSM